MDTTLGVELFRETMSQLARWQWHTLGKKQGDNGGEDYCLDWGFKSGLRDIELSLKGLSTAAESKSRCETCNRSKYSTGF